MKRIGSTVRKMVSSFNEVEIEIVSNICVAASFALFFATTFFSQEESGCTIGWLYLLGFGFLGFIAYITAVRKIMPYMHWMNGIVAQINGILISSCCWWLSISILIKIMTGYC